MKFNKNKRPSQQGQDHSGGGVAEHKAGEGAFNLQAESVVTTRPVPTEWREFRSGFRHANVGRRPPNLRSTAGWNTVRAHVSTLAVSDLHHEKAAQGPVSKYIAGLSNPECLRAVAIVMLLAYLLAWLVYSLQYAPAAFGLGLSVAGLAAVASVVSGVAWVLDGGWDPYSAYTAPLRPAALCIGSTAVLAFTAGPYNTSPLLSCTLSTFRGMCWVGFR